MQQTAEGPPPITLLCFPLRPWVMSKAFLRNYLVVPKHSLQFAFVMPLGKLFLESQISSIK